VCYQAIYTVAGSLYMVSSLVREDGLNIDKIPIKFILKKDPEPKVLIKKNNFDDLVDSFKNLKIY
jgi:hypothetical protein